jgi:hypothetical protein
MLEAEVNPKAIVQLKELGQLKHAMKSSGIEPSNIK